MGRDSKRSKEVAFLKKLKEVAAFFINKNAANLFTQFIASIPTAGCLKNQKKRTKTWNCGNCQKKFQTKDSRARHEISCKKNKHSRNKIDNKTETRKNKEKSEGNCIKTQDKNKKNKQTGSNKVKCTLCTKEFVYINAHYRKSHKINLQVWINNLRGKMTTCNGTTCLQCNFDFKDVKSFRNHLIKDHNISLLANTRKGRVNNEKSKTREAAVTATGAKQKESMGNNSAVHKKRVIMKDNPRASVEKKIKRGRGAQKERKTTKGDSNALEEREVMEDNSNAQKENETTDPTAQEETITENPKLQDKGKLAVTHDVLKRCRHCGQFWSVSSFKSHIESHKSERETFPFKTSDSSQNLNNSWHDNSSHSYETAEEIEPYQQSDFITLTDTNNDTTEQNRIRDDENHGSSIDSEEEFQTTRDPHGARTNSREENANGSHDVIEDVYIPQYITRNDEQRHQTQENERKSRFKLLWNEYYQRMLLADEKDRQKLCNKFLNVYASLSRRGAVCHRRLNFDAKRCQRRVDVVSTITSETYVKCQSGVSFTRKIVKHLKTIKYETNEEYFVNTH